MGHNLLVSKIILGSLGPLVSKGACDSKTSVERNGLKFGTQG